IPYLSIISHYDLHLSGELQYLLRFIPMLRAAYVLALVTGVLSANRISSLFSAYMALLIATLYFGSLMFFIEEHHVNPGVDTYWSALWWAIMDMTTTGSSINPVTTTGKVLGVVLAAEGLILFPVFTVYITNALTRKNKTAPSANDGAAHV
ncbi:MAG: potassium channel family protein, partial [Muribaculaceae bacterium]|nr:potassium channel family protein [Muribaculaceae bacterium]